MHSKRRSGIATVVLCFLASPAAAQSCSDLEADGFQDRSVSDQLAANRACNIELRGQLAEILGVLDQQSERIGANEFTLKSLAEQNLSVVQAAETQEIEIDAINVVLADSVLAFDRSQRTGACPRGWSLFEPAGGRMIIGAGRHPNELTEYPAYKDKPNEATGGVEAVTLTEAQMPAHNHGGALVLSTDTLYGMNNGDRYHNSGAGTALPTSGSGQPHNNMPPYIALYFCKKD